MNHSPQSTTIDNFPGCYPLPASSPRPSSLAGTLVLSIGCMASTLSVMTAPSVLDRLMDGLAHHDRRLTGSSTLTPLPVGRAAPQPASVTRAQREPTLWPVYNSAAAPHFRIRAGGQTAAVLQGKGDEC